MIIDATYKGTPVQIEAPAADCVGKPCLLVKRQVFRRFDGIGTRSWDGDYVCFTWLSGNCEVKSYVGENRVCPYRSVCTVVSCAYGLRVDEENSGESEKDRAGISEFYSDAGAVCCNAVGGPGSTERGNSQT